MDLITHAPIFIPLMILIWVLFAYRDKIKDALLELGIDTEFTNATRGWQSSNKTAYDRAKADGEFIYREGKIYYSGKIFNEEEFKKAYNEEYDNHAMASKGIKNSKAKDFYEDVQWDIEPDRAKFPRPVEESFSNDYEHNDMSKDPPEEFPKPSRLGDDVDDEDIPEVHYLGQEDNDDKIETVGLEPVKKVNPLVEIIIDNLFFVIVGLLGLAVMFATSFGGDIQVHSLEDVIQDPEHYSYNEMETTGYVHYLGNDTYMLRVGGENTPGLPIEFKSGPPINLAEGELYKTAFTFKVKVKDYDGIYYLKEV